MLSHFFNSLSNHLPVCHCVCIYFIRGIMCVYIEKKIFAFNIHSFDIYADF